MKSLFATPLSSDRIWEFSVVLILWYLVFRPPMAYPLSFAVALGGIFVLLLFKSIPKDSFQRMGKIWCLFLAYLLVSGFWSIVPGITLRSAGFAFVGTLLYLMAQDREEGNRKGLEMIGFFLALLVSAAALYEWFFGFDQLKFLLPYLPKNEFQIAQKAIFYRRPSGSLVTPGALAALLMLFIPWGFIQAWTQSGFKRKLFGFLTALMLLAFWTTQSVGAWLCLTAAVLLILLRRGSTKWALGVLTLGAAAVLGILWARGTQHWGISSLNMRFLLWKSSWELFLQHPLLGTGLGSFDEAYQEAGYSLVQGGARYPHNLFFQLLTETGLAGTSLFLAALVSFLKRFRLPSRWEGWGMMAGVLAFFLFSFLDLPFQMPELVWLFSIAAARLELKPEKSLSFPTVSTACLEWGILLVLLISGFWPPFRPWNMALVACALWTAMALLQEKLDQVPLWVFVGGLFIALRAFFSPSAIGTVWFLESAGIVLAFGLFLRALSNPERFFKWFCSLGLVWALQVWRFSFQYSDIKDWAIFPNPKQVGIFLLAVLFLQVDKPFDLKNILAPAVKGRTIFLNGFLGLFSVTTLVCLKAFDAMVGLTVGLVTLVKKQQRFWAAGLACLSIAFILYFRSMAFHDLDKNPTQWDRLSIWMAAIKVWAREPLVGVGPGVFAGLFHQVKSPRPFGASRYLMDAQYAHNEFLECLTAFGLVGLVWGWLLLKKIWPTQKPGRASALTALGTASLFDFCLHTPLLALQGAGLLSADREGKEPKPLWTAGFLALGVTLGLFGSAVFAPRLQQQSAKFHEAGQFPMALRCLQMAESLNLWNARYAVAKADYLQKLYFATGSKDWKNQAEEAYDRAIDLEPTDGSRKLDRAEWLMQGLSLQALPEDFNKAEEALGQAEEAMPFNAFVRYDQGLLYAATGRMDKAIASFQKATELEPNYALAWARVGMILEKSQHPAEARQAFQKALEVNNRWKNEERIAPAEKQLVNLPPEVLNLLNKKAFR